MTTPKPAWSTPPPDLVLASDKVHVWRASLDLTPTAMLELRRTLAADELARAKRFHFTEDRTRFIAARGALRDILARYLGTEANQVSFRYSPHGKPALAPLGAGLAAGSQRGGQPKPPLHFNLSHAGDLALVAIARGRQVGVDIESTRPDIAHDLITARSFSPREQARLRALPIHLKAQGFLNCWTRKEAYIKARGEGLSLPLDQFDVSLTPGEPARLLHVEGDAEEASRWTLAELAPGPGYVAALAVEGHGWHLACWQWQWAATCLSSCHRSHLTQGMP